MNEQAKKATELIRKDLIAKDYRFYEFNYGHFQIEGVSYWANTDRWYDTKTEVRGKGYRNFLAYLSVLPSRDNVEH